MALRPLGGSSSAGSAPAQTVWTAFKPSDTARASTATAAADPHLTIASIPAGSYALEGWLPYESATAGDIKIGWTAPASATLAWSHYGLAVAASVASAAINNAVYAVGDVQPAGTIGAGSPVALRPTGFLVVTTPGTLALTWAQNTSDATATTLRAGSWLKLAKVG